MSKTFQAKKIGFVFCADLKSRFSVDRKGLRAGQSFRNIIVPTHSW